MTSVKIGPFKPNRAGYAACQNQGGVQNFLKSKADAIKSAADANVLPDKWTVPYSYDAHEVKEITGKLANGYVVRTKTDHARLAESQRGSLTKAFGSL